MAVGDDVDDDSVDDDDVDDDDGDHNTKVFATLTRTNVLLLGKAKSTIPKVLFLFVNYFDSHTHYVYSF